MGLAPTATRRPRFAYLEVAVVSEGSGDLPFPSFGDGVCVGGGGLRCTSGYGENTNGSGGLRRSFLDGWLDADGSIRAWWWLRWWLGSKLGLDGENYSGWLLI
jgi:hypothetical protein